MKAKSKEETTNRRTKLNSVFRVSFAVVCCVLYCTFSRGTQIQEHYRVLSQSATFCDQMENEILQKVQQNYERWQIYKGSTSDGDWFEVQGKVISPYRSPGGSLLDEGYIQLYAL